MTGRATARHLLNQSLEEQIPVPRKVVFFVESKSFGGTEQVVLNLLRSLDHKLWQPILFHHPELGIAPLLQGVSELGIPSESVPRFDHGNLPRAAAHFFRKLRSHGPAIFHAHLTWTLGCRTALSVASFTRRNAVLATLHLFTEVDNPRTILTQRALALRVDRYIGVAQHVAQRLRETLHLPASKVDVVPNGIPVSKYRVTTNTELRAQLAPRGAGPIVLTVARLEDCHKGISWLLKAAVLVPEAKFVIAGDGPDRERLQNLAAELCVQHRVVFLGFRRDIAELLSCCDAFVLPSLFEGLCLVLLEAMAAGKPVVATDIAGTNEVIIPDETGLLVPPANAEALAAAIKRVLHDPSLAARLAAAGNTRVTSDFSSDSMARGISLVYDQLFSSSHRIARLGQFS